MERKLCLWISRVRLKWKMETKEKLFFLAKNNPTTLIMHALSQWSWECISEISINLFSTSSSNWWWIPRAAPTWVPADVTDFTLPPSPPPHVICHGQVPERHISPFDRTSSPWVQASCLTPLSFPLHPKNAWIGNSRRESESFFGLPSVLLLNPPEYGCFSENWP